MKLIDVKKVQVTKSLAEKWASMETCPHDRPLNTRRLKLLEDDVLNGLAIPFVWAKAILNGKEIRVNGKHSSTVLARLENFPTGLVATIQEYHCENMEDVAKLYAQFDNSLNARSQKDVNRAIQFSSELADVRIHAFDVCASGIVLARYGHNTYGTKNHVTPERRPEIAIEEQEFVRWYVSLVSSDEAQDIIEKSSVVSAMYLTWKKSKTDATRFWSAVRDGTEQVGSATRVLQKYLLTTVCRNSGKRGKKNTDSPPIMEIRCLHAWNAWRNGGRTDLKCYGSKRPRVD